MLEKFKDIKFKPDSVDRIEKCNDIIDDYKSQGLRLTLRQLYYQLVTKNVIPNVERSYKNLSSLVTDARMAGLMDWNAIEDRVRVPRVPQEFDDLKDLVEAAIRSYRLPRWRGQENYVELWVEKDALAGVLRPIATKYHITLMVNRGYSSASAMYESAQRFINQDAEEHHLLYLGDHDPSGEDMVRDVAERLETFGSTLHVKKLALTMDQVDQYNPPPNPAKMSDPRSDGYVAKHGNESWEVDALPPQVLTQVIEDELDMLVDQPLMDEIIEREEEDKKELQLAAVRILRKQKRDKKEED
jgi:hypothetical protein